MKTSDKNSVVTLNLLLLLTLLALMITALIHFRTLVTLRRVRVGLELRLRLVRARIRVRVRVTEMRKWTTPDDYYKQKVDDMINNCLPMQSAPFIVFHLTRTFLQEVQNSHQSIAICCENIAAIDRISFRILVNSYKPV